MADITINVSGIDFQHLLDYYKNNLDISLMLLNFMNDCHNHVWEFKIPPNITENHIVAFLGNLHLWKQNVKDDT